MSENSKDYIPRREADLLPWAENFARKAKTYAQELEIPASEISALDAIIIYYKSLYQQSKSPECTKAIIVKKDEAKADMIKLIRTMHNFRLQNPGMTNDMRVEFGLHQKDLNRTPHIDVKETVAFETVLGKIREIIVRFWIKGEQHHAKPDGYDGAVIVWAILDAPPSDPDELTRHAMASKTPYTLKFKEAERGKTVYMALSWQNERGHIGEWSEIKPAIIP